VAQSDTVFAGSIPQFYDQKLGGLLFAPYAADMARRLGSLASGRLLETAAGTGIVTRQLAVRLPAAVEIVATDLNQPMLDYAASQPGLHRVKWQPADAQALPFPDGSFNVVLCQFGAMFFPDRVKAYREARRVLKPGGQFLFNVWDRIETSPVMAAAVEAMTRRYPQQKSWFLERTPCGYHDRAVITQDVKAAGFAVVQTSTVKLSGKFATSLDAATGLCQGTPMRAEIEALDKDGLDAATRAAAEVITQRCGPGPASTPLQAVVVETTK
jgi:ubiquinone/menaquinone biosynthesis C-methylase UbiE